MCPHHCFLSFAYGFMRFGFEFVETFICVISVKVKFAVVTGSARQQY